MEIFREAGLSEGPPSRVLVLPCQRERTSLRPPSKDTPKMSKHGRSQRPGSAENRARPPAERREARPVERAGARKDAPAHAVEGRQSSKSGEVWLYGHHAVA